MTKEFLLVGYETKAVALHALRNRFSIYLASRKASDWRWKVEPEALQGEDGRWRAYGRVEWSNS